MTCKWLLILTGSGSIAVSRGLAEFSPRLPKRPTLSIVCGFSYKPWPTVQYFNIIEQFWKTFWSRISLCYCYRGFWGIRHFEWTISTVKRGDLGNSTLLIIIFSNKQISAKDHFWHIWQMLVFHDHSVRGYVAVTHLRLSLSILDTDRPTSLSSVALAFKKRCLCLFTGIRGTWMHRFAFWKFYSKPE